jgi:glycosyltransferase involved in cell wall biosynthesis
MALAPLEAMASARSVVAFDVDGLPGVLRRHGAVVPAGAVHSLADAVAQRLVAPERCAAEGEANRAEVADRYSLARATAATSDVYRRVLTERAMRRG